MKMKTKLIHEHMHNTVRKIATACAFFLFDPSAMTEKCSEGPRVGPAERTTIYVHRLQ